MYSILASVDNRITHHSVIQRRSYRVTLSNFIIMLICFLLIPNVSFGTVIPFNVELTVTGVVYQSSQPDCLGEVGTPSFLCNNAVGDIHKGHFLADDGLLAMEGDAINWQVQDFYLKIGDWEFIQSPLIDNFRILTGGVLVGDLSTNIVTFSVHNGSITGIYGGLLGDGDAWGVEFQPFPSVPYGVDFCAYDYFTTQICGDVRISKANVPEPGTISLLLAGLLFYPLIKRQTFPA